MPNPKTPDHKRTKDLFGNGGMLQIMDSSLWITHETSVFSHCKWEQRPPQWTKEATQAFDQLKKTLMSAPALGLPDMSKPFFLFSHEKQGIALGILAQNLGTYRTAVAYLSRQLDAAAKGWPGCLRAVTVAVLNIQEAH